MSPTFVGMEGDLYWQTLSPEKELGHNPIDPETAIQIFTVGERYLSFHI
jgi:hypothetical protein